MDKQKLNIFSNNPHLPPLISEPDPETSSQPAGRKSAGVMTCPECHISMVRFGLCFACPLCGLGSCG